MKFLIREANKNDISSIVEMAQGFYNEAIKQLELNYSPKDYGKYILFLIENTYTTVLVLEYDKKIVGTIAGIVAPWFMAYKDVVLTEQWIWVEPGYRKKGAFMELLRELISWGKRLGANKIIVTAIGSGTEEQVRKFYNNKGFQYMETHFIKEI